MYSVIHVANKSCKLFPSFSLFGSVIKLSQNAYIYLTVGIVRYESNKTKGHCSWMIYFPFEYQLQTVLMASRICWISLKIGIFTLFSGRKSQKVIGRYVLILFIQNARNVQIFLMACFEAVHTMKCFISLFVPFSIFSLCFTRAKGKKSKI